MSYLVLVTGLLRFKFHYIVLKIIQFTAAVQESLGLGRQDMESVTILYLFIFYNLLVNKFNKTNSNTFQIIIQFISGSKLI